MCSQINEVAYIERYISFSFAYEYYPKLYNFWASVALSSSLIVLFLIYLLDDEKQEEKNRAVNDLLLIDQCYNLRHMTIWGFNIIACNRKKKWLPTIRILGCCFFSLILQIPRKLYAKIKPNWDIPSFRLNFIFYSFIVIMLRFNWKKVN